MQEQLKKYKQKALNNNDHKSIKLIAKKKKKPINTYKNDNHNDGSNSDLTSTNSPRKKQINLIKSTKS